MKHLKPYNEIFGWGKKEPLSKGKDQKLSNVIHSFLYKTHPKGGGLDSSPRYDPEGEWAFKIKNIDDTLIINFWLPNPTIGRINELYDTNIKEATLISEIETSKNKTIWRTVLFNGITEDPNKDTDIIDDIKISNKDSELRGWIRFLRDQYSGYYDRFKKTYFVWDDLQIAAAHNSVELMEFAIKNGQDLVDGLDNKKGGENWLEIAKRKKSNWILKFWEDWKENNPERMVEYYKKKSQK